MRIVAHFPHISPQAIIRNSGKSQIPRRAIAACFITPKGACRIRTLHRIRQVRPHPEIEGACRPPDSWDVARQAGEEPVGRHADGGATMGARRIPVGQKSGELIRQAIGDRQAGPIFLSPAGKAWTVPNLSRTYSRLRDVAGLPRDLALYLARHPRPRRDTTAARAESQPVPQPRSGPGGDRADAAPSGFPARAANPGTWH